MKKTLLILVCIMMACLSGPAQTLPASRAVDWTLAGLRDTSTSGFVTVDMATQGAVADGTTPNDSVVAHVLSSTTASGIILQFGAGDYLFNSSLRLPSNTIIRGAGAESTTFIMDLGGSGHGIDVRGSVSKNVTTQLQNAAQKGAGVIDVANAGAFSAGDWIQIAQDDSDLITSSWAANSVGQIVRIESISGNSITLASPLRLDYNLARSPFIFRINPTENVGVECLKILRMDDTAPQQSCNINFRYAVNSWVTGIESENCTYSHIQAVGSSNIYIARSYLHHGFSYGTGGRAYGVMLHTTTNECLIEDNVFERLRHAMILQAGANANVFAYNYSTDPFWSSYPTNSAGDMVLHGNYVYANLFEQNLGHNIVIDNSHGPNGPYNTFFRNRALSYGIFFSADNSPSQNFLGNEIPNTSFPYSFVNYSILGTGHFLHGNNNKGTIVPQGTGSLPDESYAYATQPDFVPNNQWAGIGPPNAMGTKDIPAHDRFVSNEVFSALCPSTPSGTLSAEATTFIYDGYTWWPGAPQSGESLASDTIRILAGTAVLPNITEVARVVVAPDASLEFSGPSLLVEDSIIVEADTAGYGQVIGEVRGDAEWQTWLGSPAPRWYNNAFPVNGSVADISGAVINAGQNPNTQNIYRYDATTDSDANGEGDWVPARADDPLGDVAYQIFLSQHFGGSSALLSAYGQLQDGPREIDIYRDVNGANVEGWNYIPNPYPSNISFAMLADNNVEVINNTFYMQSGSPGTTVYSSYSAGARSGTNGGTDLIAPGQAFFVQADLAVNGSAVMRFTNDQRIFDAAPLYRKSSAPVEFLKIGAASALGAEKDQTLLGFGADFTAGMDTGADAAKMLNSNYPNVYTKLKGDPHVYNFVGDQFATHKEVLYFEAPTDGIYRLSLDEDSLPYEWQICLEDKLTGTATDLRMSDYTFDHDSANIAARFVLRISRPTVGTEETETETDLIFAHMAGDELVINAEQYEGTATALVYDLSGRMVINTRLYGGSVSHLNMSTFPVGVYILKVLSSGGEEVHTQKVVK